jgi:16S rRNA processing protein RimM
VVVGHVSKPHGTKGELFIWPLTDRPESTFRAGEELLIADSDGALPDPDLPPIRIGAVRPYRRGFLVLFDGVDDRNGAEELRDRYLLRRFEDTDPLEHDEIFYHQLLGLSVVTASGIDVGRVREVYELRPADLLEVEGPDRDYLIPFTKEVVVSWDVPAGRIVIDPPQGLLDL